MHLAPLSVIKKISTERVSIYRFIYLFIYYIEKTSMFTKIMKNNMAVKYNNIHWSKNNQTKTDIMIN